MGIAEALLAAVVDNRDDAGAWAVLGDALQTDGDPRGALVQLMMAREAKPSRRLYEAELEHRARWPELGTMAETTWWRGFAIGSRITGDALATLDDPAMQLLETIELTLEADAWPAFLELLERPRAWRRLRLALGASEEPFALAPLFAGLPALECLRITSAAPLDWMGCRAPWLALLELEDIDEIELGDAQLPALVELRLLGSSSAETLEGTPLWGALERVVVENPGENSVDAKPLVRAYRPDYDEDTPNAFVVVGGRIETKLVSELLSKMTGIEQIAGIVAHVEWPTAITAIQLRSREPIALMPYSLAESLAQHLGPGTGVALIGLYASADLACMNVLGRESYEPRANHTERRGLVRTTLDRMLGRDPGPEILRDLELALDCAFEVTSTAPDDARPLVDIDPSEPPPAPPVDDDYDQDGYDEDGEPLGTDLLDRIAVDTYGQDVDFEAIYGPEPDVVPIEVAPEEEVVEDEPEPEPSETPDDDDAWQRLDDQWESRETDPDDDASIRWPDPELAWNPFVDIDQLIYFPRCSTCANLRLLRPCSWCGEPNCSECALEDERTEVTCKSCLEDLLDPSRVAVQSDAARASYVDNPEDP